MFPRAKNHRKLQLESLEPRTLLDGTVLTALNPKTGVLAITGDARDNGVAITTETHDGAWSLKIEGTQTRLGVRAGKVTTISPDATAYFPASAVEGIAIDLKDGRNWLLMDVAGEGVERLVLAKDLILKSGKDADALIVYGVDVQGTLKVASGAGAEHLELGHVGPDARGIHVAGDASVNAGSGMNFVSVAGNFGKGLSINTTTGRDTVMLNVNVGGNLTVNTGSNVDGVSVSREVPDSIAPATIGGDASINVGDGYEGGAGFQADVNGSLRLTGGSGRDTFNVGFDSEGYRPTIQGTVIINTNAGNDDVEVSANVTGSVDIKTAAGNDAIDVGSGAIQGNLSVDAGPDADYVDLSPNVTGNVAVKTGAGDDGVRIASRSETPAAIHGNLSVDTGADDDRVGLQYVNVGVAGNPLGGNVNIATGDGGELVTCDPALGPPYFSSESVTAWGISVANDLNIDGGKGDNGVVLLLSNAADTNVKTAAGNSVIAIGQLGMNGTGTLAISNGPGDNAIFIGTDFPWESLIWDLSGTEYTVEWGVAAGAVTINTASANAGEVAIEDSYVDKTVAINVKGGDATVVLRNLHGLPIPGGFGSVAQVAIQTDKGNDVIDIAPQPGGDLGLLATNVSIKTGGGNDDVKMNGLIADRALLDLGAGDDTLTVGPLHTIVTLFADGGAGANDEYKGAWPTPPGWSFPNFEKFPTP